MPSLLLLFLFVLDMHGNVGVDLDISPYLSAKASCDCGADVIRVMPSKAIEFTAFDTFKSMMCERDPDTGKVKCGALSDDGSAATLVSCSSVDEVVHESHELQEVTSCGTRSQGLAKRHWRVGQLVSRCGLLAGLHLVPAAVEAACQAERLADKRDCATGLTSTVICFPLETVRTRLAVAPPGEFHGMIQCARQIVAREGFGALFKVHHVRQSSDCPAYASCNCRVLRIFCSACC